ncbi:MAG: FAD-dependent oxidoreductase [Sphingobium sp.]|nr:MAG: FAD-dependent oxidoreductase [Sphingobium sp.]
MAAPLFPPEHSRLLIIGGGVAGLDLACQLSGSRGRRLGLDILLVDREPAHVWKPMLHTIAAGTADTSTQQTAYMVQAHRRGFRFEQGEVVAVDRVRKQVHLAPLFAEGMQVLPARILTYDKLVLAAGSRANDFGTPGVAQHCMTIDCRREAIAFNEQLRIAALRAISQGEPLSVVIVGGGATGVELASELVRLAEIIEVHGAPARAHGGVRITLIESQERILGPFPERVASSAHAMLRQLGVDVRTNARVQSVDAQGMILSDGSRIDATLKLWAAGVRAPRFISEIEGLEHSRLGQIVVGDDLSALCDRDIFALGDCASMSMPGRQSPVPTTAQAAYQQAIYLGRQLPRMIAGQRVPPFRYHDFGALVSLGGYDAYGTLGRLGFFKGGFLRGRVAQWGHSMLYRRHQARIYGPIRGSLLWLADSIGDSIRPLEKLI